MKTISEKQQDNYDLTAKYEGYEIFDYDMFHRERIKEKISLVFVLLLYLVLGLILGISLMV